MRNTKEQQLPSSLQLRGAWQHYKAFTDAHSSAAFLLPTLLIVPFSLILSLPLSEETYELCSALTLAICFAGIGFGLVLASIMLTITLITFAYTAFGSKEAKEKAL